jgi:hypothetical protein
MAEDRSAIATLAEFTVLQRLFRLGLAGELGAGFPIERLAELHREVAPTSAPAPVRTPRWDSRPGLLERGIKTYADRERKALARAETADALRKALEPGLATVAALTQEYAVEIAARDRVLEAGKRGMESPPWVAAWDAFQIWAVGWEERLAAAAADLERGAEGVDGPLKEHAKRVAAQVRWSASAVALRRALDVNTDDKLARAARGAGPGRGGS